MVEKENMKSVGNFIMFSVFTAEKIFVMHTYLHA